MLVPAMYQGKLSPLRKKSPLLCPSLLARQMLTPMLTTILHIIIVQSTPEIVILFKVLN